MKFKKSNTHKSRLVDLMTTLSLNLSATAILILELECSRKEGKHKPAYPPTQMALKHNHGENPAGSL